MVSPHITALMHQSTTDALDGVRHISIKAKRRYFSLLRKNCDQATENWFLPSQAVTVGELCVAQVLDQETRKSGTSAAPASFMRPDSSKRRKGDDVAAADTRQDQAEEEEEEEKSETLHVANGPSTL